MSAKRCIVCGDLTTSPWLAAFHHFRLYESGNWKYLRGNCATFGLLSGIHSTLCLICPAYNTLRFWEHRKSRLTL